MSIADTVGHSSYILENAELVRQKATRELDQNGRAEKGQYFTNSVVADLMAEMVDVNKDTLRILDPGAGVGILSAALIQRVIESEKAISEINITAFEIDNVLIPFLEKTLKESEDLCRNKRINFSFEIKNKDYIQHAAEHQSSKYDVVIMNPPYGKINTKSKERAYIESAGLKTTNMYSGFVYLAIQQLVQDGQLVAITPRSFCNGTYFKAFRRKLLLQTSFKKIHVYNSRTKAFQDSDVLQENIIFRLDKSTEKQGVVKVTASDGPQDEAHSQMMVPHEYIIHPDDPNNVVHVIGDELSQHVIEKISALDSTHKQVGIDVSTGPVVDFRAKEALTDANDPQAVPLIYPTHFSNGSIKWPKALKKKSEAIRVTPDTEKNLLLQGYYVLVKRFTSKEEKRRVTSVILSPEDLPGDTVGLENHINYFHDLGEPLSQNLAYGLCGFLNTKLVDMYFRIFNGHTQINATDLRSLRYPNRQQLIEMGKKIRKGELEKENIDGYLESHFLSQTTKINPVEASNRIETTIEILKKLGLPKAQQNERSALTLLALLDLGPEDDWTDATAPMLGITEMMDYFKEKYGKTYAPNTRETVRRQTVHQFVQAGIVIPNPDEPERPPNSPNYVYQIEPNTLGLLQNYQNSDWDDQLKEFLSELPRLRDRYAAKREKQRIPIKISSDKEISISAGGQNKLVKKIIDDFCAIYTPGAELLYIGDAGSKMGFFEEEKLEGLGIQIAGKHSKMPDVVVHYTDKDWLVLIEAVTSHGPIDPKRKIELEALFKDSKVGIVYVTAFLDKKTMRKYIKDIAWETDVWVAENPTHLIHFNGERFLGPYE